MPISCLAGRGVVWLRVVGWGCLVALLTPGAVGAWMSKGSWEPDTARDRLDGWMQKNPDISPIVGLTQANNVHKVYFNGFHGEVVGSLSPNVAMLHSSVFQSASFSFYAMLGVWKDCNKDGYVGMGEQGLIEYRSELLLDRTVCKPQSVPLVPPAGKPVKDWFPVHNDGKWVREWIPIAWYPYDTAIFSGEQNPYDLNDNASRVWADFGLPGQGYSTAFACPVTSQPRGTYHSTGGLLEWTDCWFGNRLTETANDAAAIVSADNLGLGRVSFSDHEDDQKNSSSVLNQKNPWGVSEDKPYWTMWDCSSALVSQSVPTPLANPIVVRVPSPVVPTGVDPAGSPGGTLNESYKGRDCDRSERSAQGNVLVPGEVPYALEADSSFGAPKVRPDATLRPVFATRPSPPLATFLGHSAPPGPGLDDELGDFGAHVVADDGAWSEPSIVRRFEVPLVNSRIDAQASWYNTYYAYVSPTAIAKYGLTMPKTISGAAYGTDACGANIAGIFNGWDCWKDNWWKSGSEDTEPTSTILSAAGTKISARPGSPYNLRDVDCYDQSMDNVRDTSVGPGALTGQACAR